MRVLLGPRIRPGVLGGGVEVGGDDWEAGNIGAAGGQQFLRPSSDVSAGAWQPNPSSPATLYDKIDEATADDADYIFTESNSTASIGLSAGSTPDAGAQTLRIRARGSPAKRLVARLMEGANARATINVDPLTPSVTLYTATASGITDYSSLRLEFEAADATSPPDQTVSWGAAGTGASGTTSCAPSYPTGINAETSKLFCFVSGRSNTANTVPTMPSGWTRLVGFEGGTGTWGVDTGTRRCDLFIKDVVDGTESGTVTVNLAGTTNNTLRATIFRVEVPSGYSLDIATGTGQDTTNDTSFSITSGTALSFQPGDMLLAGVGQNVDTATGTSALSATGITFGAVTRRVDVAVTNGNDHRSILAEAVVSSGSGTVAPTHSYTASAACSGAGIFVRLRAVPPSEFARVTWAEFEIPEAGGQPQRPLAAALEPVQDDLDAAFAQAAVDLLLDFGGPPPQQAASTSVQLAAVEGADSVAALLGLRQGVALGATEGADTASLQVGLWQGVALAATEGSDAAAFQAGLRQSVALGTAEGSDTAAFQMGFGRQVSLSATEEADTAAAQVGLRQGVALGAVEASDAVGLQLGLRQGVALATTEGADTAAVQMGLRQSAALAAVEGADSGSFELNLDTTRTVTLGAVEGGDAALCAVFVVPLAQPPVVVVGDGGGRRRRKPRLPEPEPKPPPTATLVDSQELARALAEEGGATLLPQLRSGAGDAKVPLAEDDEIEDLLLLL